MAADSNVLSMPRLDIDDPTPTPSSLVKAADFDLEDSTLMCRAVEREGYRKRKHIRKIDNVVVEGRLMLRILTENAVVLLPVEIDWHVKNRLTAADTPCLIRTDKAVQIDHKTGEHSQGIPDFMRRTLPYFQQDKVQGQPVGITSYLCDIAKDLGIILGLSGHNLKGIEHKTRSLEQYLTHTRAISQKSLLHKSKRELPRTINITQGVFDSARDDELQGIHSPPSKVYAAVRLGAHMDDSKQWRNLITELREMATLHEQLFQDNPKHYRQTMYEAVRNVRRTNKELGSKNEFEGLTKKPRFYGFGHPDGPLKTLAYLEKQMEKASSKRPYDRANEQIVMEMGLAVAARSFAIAAGIPALARELAQSQARLHDAKELGNERTRDKTSPTIDHDSHGLDDRAASIGGR